MTAKIKHFPGTPLSEKDFQENEILFNHDELKANFAWDTGVGIGAYLASLKEGRILGTHCKTCNKVVVPARIVCEWCFNPMNEYVPLKDTGTINTFSLCYVTWDLKRVEEPEIPAVIELDGASSLESGPTMGGIMHLIDGVDPQEVHVGMKVQAVWKPPEERQAPSRIFDTLSRSSSKSGEQ